MSPVHPPPLPPHKMWSGSGVWSSTCRVVKPLELQSNYFLYVPYVLSNMAQLMCTYMNVSTLLFIPY